MAGSSDGGETCSSGRCLVAVAAAYTVQCFGARWPSLEDPGGELRKRRAHWAYARGPMAACMCSQRPWMAVPGVVPDGTFGAKLPGIREELTWISVVN